MLRSNRSPRLAGVLAALLVVALVGVGCQSDEEKIAKLAQRLAKAQAKCEQVRKAGGDNLAAFEASVANLQQKLDAAKAEAQPVGHTDEQATPQVAPPQT